MFVRKVFLISFEVIMHKYSNNQTKQPKADLKNRTLLMGALGIDAASFFEAREKDIAESPTLVVTPKEKN